MSKVQTTETLPAKSPDATPLRTTDGVGAPTGAELTMATNADDVTVAVTGEMDFAGNPEYAKLAIEEMVWWDKDEDGNLAGDRVEKLKAKWGNDLGASRHQPPIAA